MITHLSLFSGIGGLDLAAEWAGFITVGQCEMADFPTKILEKHWPDVPRWRDIRTLTKESFYERTGLRTVDIVSGGFPCQPFSVAGKQKGREDDRYLWPEMRRVIAELKPRWVLGENVPGILRIAAADVIQDLERVGYHVVLFDFEAASVGAPHHRERIGFVANRDSMREQSASGSEPEGGNGPCNSSENVADTHRRKLRDDGNNGRPADREEYETANAGDAGREEAAFPDSKSKRQQRQWAKRLKISGARFETGESKGIYYVCNATGERLPDGSVRTMGEPEKIKESQRPVRWPAEPDVGRVAHGVPHRVDRIKGLGNAVCPPQFYPIFKAIAEWENR